MSKFVALLLVSFIFISSCKQKQENVLADIKKNYAEINAKLKDYTRKQVDDITSPGAGSITGYYRDDEIKKITAQRYTDTNRVFSDYYFEDGMLIFVVEQDFVYNKPVSYTEEVAKLNNDSVWYDDKQTRMQVSRFYFHKNKLIKWLNADNIDVPVNNSGFDNKQSELWAQAVVQIKQLKEQ